MADWMPIFPLRVVLFPGSRLVLRIFESRYKAMLKDCEKNKKPFGIVFTRHEEGDERVHMASVGCVASIVENSPFEDGTYMVQVEGLERFKINELDRESKPYLLAQTETLREDPDMPLDDPIQDSVETLLEVYRELIMEVDPSMLAEVDEEHPLADLSHMAFEQMILPDEKRQEALETLSTRSRHEMCLSMLRVEIETLRFLLSEDGEDQVGHMN